jgi:hypothetical protein
MKNKTFYISIGVAIFFLIGGMALGGVLTGGSAWSFFKLSPRLAVVDMQALIAKGSQHLAKTTSHKALGKGSAKVSSHQIQEVGEQLKETLEAFAAKHHLILLSKGVVMGGNLPDYTAEIMEDAFPDYTATLMAFIKNRIVKDSTRPEDFKFESLKLKGQSPESKGYKVQENHS